MRFSIKALAIFCGMLSTFCFSAFIQSPIPPSSNKNFFEDANGDGRMDRVEITFLGNLSREYLDSSVKSLTFYFPDSNGVLRTFSYKGSEIPFDSTQKSSIVLDLSSDRNIDSKTTSIDFSEYDSERQFATLEFNNSEVMQITLFDKLKPQIRSAFIAKSLLSDEDTLHVQFTESVDRASPDALFKFKRDGKTQTYHFAKTEWSESNLAVMLSARSKSDFPAVHDSICFVEKPYSCVLISSLYPFKLRTNSLVEFAANDTLKNVPVFERVFADTAEAHPTKEELGVAMNLGGSDFKDYLKELSGDTSKVLNPSDLKFYVTLRIYTQSGEYVTSVHAETSCSDSRFPNSNCLDYPQTFFLKWNLMSSRHRAVGTGTYIAKIFAGIFYKNIVLYRNDIGETAIQTWGVKRR